MLPQTKSRINEKANRNRLALTTLSEEQGNAFISLQETLLRFIGCQILKKKNFALNQKKGAKTNKFLPNTKDVHAPSTQTAKETWSE